jgi:hypothetical protein
MKNPDDWARIFKLHNCIGNDRFAKQVKAIQEDAINSKTIKSDKLPYKVVQHKFPS